MNLTDQTTPRLLKSQGRFLHLAYSDAKSILGPLLIFGPYCKMFPLHAPATIRSAI
jgi:hypothetical protein